MELNTLLMGIVGSTAYGLAQPDSDIDKLGVYIAPTEQFLGLRPPVGKRATQSSTDPDITQHEIGKFATLCLASNPTAMELLWLPDELYTIYTPFGAALISIRNKFLSQGRVRNAYLGYASQQLTKLAMRSESTPARAQKHGRHLYRLLEQGTTLWQTGSLPIRVRDPQVVFEFGERVVNNLELARGVLMRAESVFDLSTPLPLSSDERSVEMFLRQVRTAYLPPADEYATMVS